MPAITKKEAYLKRGGAEMRKIMSNESARRKMLGGTSRPHTVSDLESLKYGHSQQLGKHTRETTEKYAPRERIILKQRYIGYPTSVPDLAVDAADETFDRRMRHKRLLDEHPTAFKKKFEQECTSDFFHQKHMIRDYLSTMHPYSDPLDRGRTYSVSRLKIIEMEREALPPADFLQPEDPTRPRTTGYSVGHTRSMLGLDSFGPKSAEKHRIARQAGEIPSSPNTDRERAIDNASPGVGSYGGSRPESPSNSTVSTLPEKRRQSRPSTGHLDDPGLYIPIGENRGHNYASNNIEMGHPSIGTIMEDVDAPGPGMDHTLPVIHHPEAQTAEEAFQAQQEKLEKERLMRKVRPNLMEGFEKRFPGFIPSKRAVTADPTYNPRDPRQSLRNSRNGRNGRSNQNNHSSSSKRSGMGARGGRKPSGVPLPENTNTLTGQLGYHGQAIGKAERLLQDPIGRGWEYYHTRNDRKDKRVNIIKKKVKEYDSQMAVDVEIERAKIDFNLFEKALEFRRTAKPADLPENKSNAARKRRGSKG